MEVIKMPSIEQFTGFVKNIKQAVRYMNLNSSGGVTDQIDLENLEAKGSIKIHGTNASVCSKNGEVWFQSKRNIITIDKDNAGFAFFMNSKDEFQEKVKELEKSLEAEEVCVYGEFAGKGIQKGVAISELEKKFFLFGVKYRRLGSEIYEWVRNPEEILSSLSDNETIFSMFDFKTFKVDIDFKNLNDTKNKLIEITEEVEKECPVGKHFGVSGIGEGVVYVVYFGDERYTFKVKGEKHSQSKVKTIKTVDLETENKKIECANKVCVGWRLEQGLQETFDLLNGGNLDIKRLGDYIRWVIADIRKEELDIISSFGLEPQDINKYVSGISRDFFLEKLNEESFS